MPEEARAILNEKKLEALCAGEGGIVVSQIPQAGQQVPEGSQILLYLGQDKYIKEITDEIKRASE